MTKPDALAELEAYSAEIGSDPLLIQGAGGNTSVKCADMMWIKASGTKLKEADRKDIFVGVDGEAIAAAVRAGSEQADQPQNFLIKGTLKPSIETCLHAILPHRVVIHVHCVNTIAGAIRQDAPDYFAKRLHGFAWAYVPYTKPGANLAAKVLEASDKPEDVYILGNHGLLIGAQDVPAARACLNRVVEAVQITPVLFEKPLTGPDTIETCFGPFMRAPETHPLHTAALSEEKTRQLATSALFPDQVLFIGPDVATIVDQQTADSVLEEAARRYGKPPVAFLLKGKAAYQRADCSQTELEMLQCLGDVMVRTPTDTPLSFLTQEDCAALLNWDAETYRHQLNAYS